MEEIQDAGRIEMIRTKILECEQEIGKGIIGQKEIVRLVLMAMMTNGNVLLEGLPGLGKTQLVKTIADVMGLTFSRIQFTPDLMPADVTGTNLIVKEEGKNVFQFEAGPIFANLVLADEINRATPKTQSALLEAMQEQTVTVGKITYKLPAPFLVLATQNPIENEGTYPLPEAQLDRFLYKLNVLFPKLEELKKIMDITVTGQVPKLEQKIEAEEMLEARRIIQKMPIAEAVQQYALSLVIATHPEVEDSASITKKYITCGVSPRAAQAVFLGAKARAFLDGRWNVSFEDVKYVVYPAFRHRIILNFEAIADSISQEEIIKGIIEEVKY